MDPVPEVADSKVSTGFDHNLYGHCVKRLYPLAHFAAARMDRRTSEYYLRYIAIINVALEDAFPTSGRKLPSTIGNIIDVIESALSNTPLEVKSGLWNSVLTSRAADDALARRLAAEHSLELAISYSRFVGVHPGSYEDSDMKNRVKWIVKFDSETARYKSLNSTNV